eukprot:2702709-Rhodomonas_salina.1
MKTLPAQLDATPARMEADLRQQTARAASPWPRTASSRNVSSNHRLPRACGLVACTVSYFAPDTV